MYLTGSYNSPEMLNVSFNNTNRANWYRGIRADKCEAKLPKPKQNMCKLSGQVAEPVTASKPLLKLSWKFVKKVLSRRKLVAVVTFLQTKKRLLIRSQKSTFKIQICEQYVCSELTLKLGFCFLSQALMQSPQSNLQQNRGWRLAK